MDVFETEDMELSEEQSTRVDEIYDAVYEMCKVLTENPDLKWDMYYIGDIADHAASILCSSGNRVRYPAVVTEDDGKQYTEEYYGGME